MDFEDFSKSVSESSGGMIPIFRELLADTLTPPATLVRLREGGKPCFLLESVEGGERISRFSFVGTGPSSKIYAQGDNVRIEAEDGRWIREDSRSFFDVFAEEMVKYQSSRTPGLPPFTGGPVGYISYDAIRYIENIPDSHEREDDLPDVLFYIFDTVVAFDHARHRLLLITNVLYEDLPTDPSELRKVYDKAQDQLDHLQEQISQRVSGEEAPARIPKLPPLMIDEGMRSNFTQEQFEAAVIKAKEYIASGDAFQIVLSQRFEKETDIDPFAAYRFLRALNPSPYLFYLEWGETALFGSSPEILVKVEDRVVSVRPIAGTRPRGKTPQEDQDHEEDLLADEKELAEHRMLVDLGRNDVGRVAKFGTIELSKLQIIERYSHVMHIVSEVEGELQEGLDSLDAFQAGFPAGTVSGAPKIRAMEIIDELEPTRRGIYAGAVGYLDFAGNLDTCIAIRTIVFHKGKVRIQAGAGLVADSVPETEYMETVHKATALFEAVRSAEVELGEKRAKEGRGS